MDKPVVYFGSYMHCIFGCGQKIPLSGETLIGEESFVDYSGKGNAQAFMCARMGTETEYIGRLGADSEGEQALHLFKEFGLINTDHIIIDEQEQTGVAIILTNAQGNNAILSVPGTNFCFSKDDFDRNEDLIKASEWICFVLETNQDIVEYGIRRAKQLGVKTFLDPSPAAQISEDVYPCIDLIKPNEYEASVLTGIDVTDEMSALAAGRNLLEKGVGAAVITLGGQGAVLVTKNGAWYFSTPKVTVVDTTSAGDIFGGTLVALLNQGKDITEAVAYASCAGALATTKIKPILDVIPQRAAVEMLAHEYLSVPTNIRRL